MNIELHLATEHDLPLVMAWRSNPLVYQGFVQQKKPLIWEEHINWFRSRNQDWRTFIVFIRENPDYIYGVDEPSKNDRPIGVVTIGGLEHWNPEIGYYIGEISLWGKGYGKEAVRKVIEWLKGNGKEYCHTTILDNNERSIRLVKSLGFEYRAKAREGESWWQKKL